MTNRREYEQKDPVLISQYYDQIARSRASHNYKSLTSAGESNVSSSDARSYQRQAELNRLATIASTMNVGADIGLYSGASAAMSATGLIGGGIAGAAASVLAPLAVTAAPMAMVNRSLDDYLSKRRGVQSIAGDIDRFGGRLGFNRSLSYNESTSLGSDLYSEFSRKDGFFNKEQQERIHKIGISNDLLSARGTGSESGSIQQYKDNFSKLKSTTEEVVKMMKTTIEGGLGIIKEMQGMGFGSLDDIKNQVKQTKAYGDLTGVGTTNMTSIGFSGASYAQRMNPYWKSSSGASMYQTGAATAGYMGQGSAGGASAVRGVGGVANAGGILARMQMENLQGDIGTKFMAFAMKPDGTVDQNKLNNLVSGGASAYDVVTGSNTSGYNMGPSGRVLFGRNKREALNNLSDSQRSRLDQMSFNLWGQGRDGSDEAKAWAYSGQKTSDPRERELYFQSLMNPRGYAQMHASSQIVEQMSNPLINTRKPWLGKRMANSFGETISNLSEDIGQNIIGPTERAVNNLTGGVSNMFQSAMGGVGRFVLNDPSYTFGNQGLGRRRESLSRAYGLSRPLNLARGAKELQRFRDQGSLGVDLGGANAGLDFDYAGQNFRNGTSDILGNFNVNELTTKELMNLSSIVTTASFQDDPSSFFKKNRMIRELTGLTNQSANKIADTGQSLQYLSSLGNAVNNRISSAPKAYEDARSKMDQWVASSENGMTTKDKQHMVANAREIAFSGGDISSFMPVVKNLANAQLELANTKGIRGASTKSFIPFDKGNFESGLTGFFSDLRNANGKDFREFSGGRDFSNPNTARSMLDEMTGIERRVGDDPSYIPSRRERETLDVLRAAKTGDRMMYNRVKSGRGNELAGETREFYASRAKMSLEEIGRSNVNISPKVRDAITEGYITGSGGVDPSFIRSNLQDFSNVFGMTPGSLKGMRSKEDAENMFFNSMQAKENEKSIERSRAKINADKLAAAIVNGDKTAELIPLNKSAESDGPKEVSKGDFENQLRAYEHLSQKPEITTDNYGKSTVATVQPMVLNHWNSDIW